MTDHDPAMGDPEVILSGFDQLPLLVGMFEGRDLVLVGCNATARATYGGRRMVGRPWREVMPEMLPQGITERLEQVYATGEPFHGREWRAQVPWPDGGANEIFVNFSLVPWRRADGSVRGVIAAGQEITDLARARGTAEARHQEAHSTAFALQKAQLPTDLPVVPGLTVAARHRLAQREAAAGGDWFDAVALPDGAVALVVGDVVGHGVAASAAMGQLRAVVQERLLSGAGTAETLTAADRYASHAPAARAATACVAILEPGSGWIAYTSAGHPPPLVVAADGTPRYLPVSGQGPLATGSRYAERREDLGDGELLLLYSDGIIERPGRTPAEASAELLQVASDTMLNRAFPYDSPADSAERVVTQTMELLTRATGHSDDITLLAARRARGPAPLKLSLPARADSQRTLRFELGQWLLHLPGGPDDETALQHAVGEVVTNAVEHGYAEADPPNEQDAVTVDARLAPDGRVEVTVCDRGRWRQPTGTDPYRGRGLTMAGELVEDLTLRHDDFGTVATLRHRMRRPAVMDEADGRLTVPPPSQTAPVRLTIHEDVGRPGRQSLTGPIDRETVPQLARHLRHATRHGTVPLTLDLTGVTHLASAGVQLLHTLTDLGARQGAPLTLYAPEGSVAGHVLHLVALPHTATDPDTGGP